MKLPAARHARPRLSEAAAAPAQRSSGRSALPSPPSQPAHADPCVPSNHQRPKWRPHCSAHPWVRGIESPAAPAGPRALRIATPLCKLAGLRLSRKAVSLPGRGCCLPLAGFAGAAGLVSELQASSGTDLAVIVSCLSVALAEQEAEPVAAAASGVCTLPRDSLSTTSTPHAPSPLSRPQVEAAEARLEGRPVDPPSQRVASLHQQAARFVEYVLR